VDDLQNMNDLVSELEGISIRTSQGSFVKMEDVRRLVEKRKSAQTITEATEPKPKTVEQARAGAKKFLEEQTGLPPLPNIGRAIPASDTAHPSSRT
jgi:hypothetical protein